MVCTMQSCKHLTCTWNQNLLIEQHIRISTNVDNGIILDIDDEERKFPISDQLVNVDVLKNSNSNNIEAKCNMFKTTHICNNWFGKNCWWTVLVIFRIPSFHKFLHIPRRSRGLRNLLGKWTSTKSYTRKLFEATTFENIAQVQMRSNFCRFFCVEFHLIIDL